MDKQKLTWDDIKEEVWWYKCIHFSNLNLTRRKKCQIKNLDVLILMVMGIV